MKIIIDAMGGDNAPEQIVQGAIAGAKKHKVDLIMVGRGDEILEAMKDVGLDTLPEGVEIFNADDVVDMHDEATNVLRTHKNSSLVQGLKLLADGKGDAFISAGSTGALLTAATLLVKRVRGVRRAAFGPIIPTKTGSCMMIDSGANAECTPEFLLQFGCMGSFCMQKIKGIASPRVGLLNIGVEDTKGTQLQKDAYELLKKADANGLIRFVGNVEARDVPLGAVDVVVCDGFSGNVLLKSIEGTALFMASQLKKMFSSGLSAKIGYLFCRKGVNEFKKIMDYRETGGTMLFGITRPVIKAHGSSDATAISNAILQAKQAAESGVIEMISENISRIGAIKEL